MSNQTRSIPVLLASVTALVLSATAACAATQDPELQQDQTMHQAARDQDLPREPVQDEPTGPRNGDLTQDESEDQNRGSESRASEEESESAQPEPPQSELQSEAAVTPEPMQEQSAAQTRESPREPEAMERSEATVSGSEPAAEPNAVTASVQAKFDALDPDHDGTIDHDEAAASQVLASQFSALDTKGDGKLTIDEFAAASDIALIRNEHRDYEQE